MPLPKPQQGEDKDKFVSRCISEIYPSEYGQREALAICYNIYEGKTVQATKTISPFQRKAEEFQLLSAEKDIRLKGIELADYPWDECVSDMTERYGDEETANKVCGMIRAKYGNAKG
jgi:hypothetical protein